MITDAFDKSEVLFEPKDFYGEQKHLCEKCIIVFSEVIFEYMLETFAHANSHFPRPAGPHFPASQGHIKRSALEIGRARGAPPC